MPSGERVSPAATGACSNSRDSACRCGRSSSPRPNVPLLIEVDLARTHPALAVLSAICHGGDPEVDAVFPALAEALETLGPKRAILYYDIVLAGLPQAPRARWEAFMSTAVGPRYHSELFRRLDAQAEARGKAEGKAEGEGHAVITVLKARGIVVPDAVREQILACTDHDRLNTWLQRAVTATTADEFTRA
nr:hypothetical protein [Micromonospora sp. DSM 115978]